MPRPAQAAVRNTRSPDLPAIWRESVEAEAVRELLAAHDCVAISGVSGGAVSFFLASALAPADGPFLVVTSTQEEAEEIVEEAATLSGADALFFPPWESLFLTTSLPDEDIFFERLRVLRSLSPEEEVRGAGESAPAYVVAPVHAVLQPVPEAGELARSIFRVSAGDELARDDFARRLADADFRQVPIVLRRGEFSVRGDILDLFPYDAREPIRVEYFGDTIDSMRMYDVETQRSLPDGEIESRDLLLAPVRSMFRQPETGRERSVLDLVPARHRVVVVDPAAVRDRVDRIGHNILGDERGPELAAAFSERLEERPRVHLYPLGIDREDGSPSRQLELFSVERFQSQELGATLDRMLEDLDRGVGFSLYCDSKAERKRIREILRDHLDGLESRVDVRTGTLRRGFESRAISRVVLATRELFNRRIVRRARKVPVETQVVTSFFELKEGDLVVHLSHGIGRYLGVTHMEKEGVLQELLTIEYRKGAKVHVPASKIDLVQKYVGRGTHTPPLDRIGGTAWERRKESVESAIMDFASELLEVQALREDRPGEAFPSDDEWQRQFEAAFPFEDTPDQHQATIHVKDDLCAPRPMDRLLCGDVGYGKTEVAMRAAFKVVNASRQVVILVPTTVLAQQHCRTFRERMAGFPIRVEQLSRFCTTAEARRIVEAARAGQVDILIGTHRVLSDDVGFLDLGLVVIDEEQRFGVGHKEKLKRLRATVDLLTLTATPIPRTLHMSLLGIRDISSLSTPPEGRSPIQTEVMEFDRPRIREAIIRELNREGQVYFVHNRIKDIAIVRHELEQIVPEARIEFAHGQMTEKELEDIMMRFLSQRIDVLVSTTIIETGIDIPNVNTIFINECDRFGLADLHQLRGRVGRSRHRAYCYLITPEHRHMNPDARKRVDAIREFSQLGAGFQIAMRDLEIRGAGNILGAQQSGHIAVVGYDLYCRLLESAVKRLRGETVEKAVDVEIDLNIEAYVPPELIPQESTRLEMYRRVSRTQELEVLEDLMQEIRDRWGPLTPQVRNLVDVQRLRILAARAGVRSIAYDEEAIVLRCTEAFRETLDTCPLRVVVLDPVRVALVVNKPGALRSIELDDEMVFHAMLAWLETGTFPMPIKRAKALRKRGAGDTSGRRQRRAGGTQREG